MRTPSALPLALALVLAPLAACGPGGEAVSQAAVRGGAVAPTTVVMTRNLYVGADLFRPFVAADPLAEAALVFQDILASDPAGRMAAVAEEIAKARPDLVGLQEAYRFEVRPLGPGGPAPFDLDFLDALELALASRPEPLAYRRVAVQPHTTLTLPLPSAGVIVTMIDRDAILADEDVSTSGATGDDFVAAFTTTVPIPVVQKRGFAAVDAVHGDAAFTFVNTHLETKDFGPLQSLQALELVARLGATSPLVVVGDTNSDPGDPEPLPGLPTPYSILTAALEDAWRSSSIEGSYTCCFDADIAPPSRPLFERVDLVLLRGATTTRAPHRVGVAPVAALGPRYASDHAGVVATLLVEPRGDFENGLAAAR